VLRGMRGAWPEFDLAKYAARFRERYQRLDLAAMNRAEEERLDTQLLLGSVFVPPDAREAVPLRELPREYREALWVADAENADATRAGWEESEARPARTVLGDEKSRLLVVFGDPGAGKTVLMRDVCLHALASLDDPTVAMPEGLEALAGHLPLLIELRNYVVAKADGHCRSFLEYWH
jgi:chromosomal replication initiation ATPase DnaA